MPKRAEIISFYPGTNRTNSPAEKNASNAISATKSVIPPDLAKLVVQNYFRGYSDDLDKSSPYLSPGLAPDELVKEVLPRNIYLHTCEWDWLLVEEEVFCERLKGLGKRVAGGMVRGVPHSWDKNPTFWRGGGLQDQVYGEAMEAFGGMVGL